MTDLTSSVSSRPRNLRPALLGVAACLLLWGCGQPGSGVGSPVQNGPATWLATVAVDPDIALVYVLSVQQGRVLSADIVGMYPEGLDEVNKSDGRTALSPECAASRLSVGGLEQSGLTIFGRINWPRGDEPAATVTFTITLSKELQGPGPVPARITTESAPDVHDLVFKRHPGLKLAHKSGDEEVPGPVAKTEAPPAEPVVAPAGPVVKLDSPLYHAIMNGEKAAAMALIAQGAPVNTRDDKYGSSPLRWAVFNSRDFKEIVEALIAHGADVNARDNNGWTPLHWATERGHADIVELLIAHGANVNARNKIRVTPLFYAHTQEIARLLIDKGADISAKTPDGGTLLNDAADHGWAEVTELLLARGAKVNAKNDDDQTALHFAGSKEVAEVLIAHGADLNAKNVMGDTPLHRNAGFGREGKIAETLLAHGADVNVKNKKGSTPLHYAAENGRLEVAATLLAHGAAVNATDNKGRTPLKIALLTLKDLSPPKSATDKRAKELLDRYEALAKLLREHGAKE